MSYREPEESDQVTVEDADFRQIYETFRECEIGDIVSFTSHFPAGGGYPAEFFAYSGVVTESDVVMCMPGIAVESDDPDDPSQARIVYPLSEDRSLGIRFVESDGTVADGGSITSLTIEVAA